jgi:stage II sporulation protein GA (sporulation sigma-E factor processing peptidase)
VQGFVVILSAVIIVMFYFKGGKGGLVPVQLKHQGKTMTLMALRDTGNMLRDPVSGKPVLVVSPDVAQDLLGLTHEQLRKPIESIGALPGLRLIPYKTIGQHGAMMLGMRLQEVRIGLRKGNGLVAFAPERIGSGGAYKALTGG